MRRPPEACRESMERARGLRRALHGSAIRDPHDTYRQRGALQREWIESRRETREVLRALRALRAAPVAAGVELLPNGIRLTVRR